ncbi:MAG: hypothetical protein SO366_02985 [Atopobiaceae bacterium]|nr:hypothetical protein [Atopobiaceae bacterium]
MDVDDFTQTVGHVMRQERLDFYAWPLQTEDRLFLFRQWIDRNSDAVEEMEQAAIAIDAMGRRVSTKYLIERQRYEGHAVLRGVPFHDAAGRAHAYGINNSDTSLLARWLLERHPKMRIETRASMFDEEAV